MNYNNIVVLTGAGISAESGLSTFRDEDGLWCEHRIEDVATPEAFTRDPATVHRFYNMRRAQLADVAPNNAHKALAKLEKSWKESGRGEFLLVTQNVDNLHRRAGSNAMIAMHGELTKVRCTETEQVMYWPQDSSVTTVCPCCGQVGAVRPHIVWFGEMPLEMDAIYTALAQCDLFISIGTSGNVYPAAGFVQEAKLSGGAHTVEINLEPSLSNRLFDEKIYGKAGDEVPKYVERIMSEVPV